MSKLLAVLQVGCMLQQATGIRVWDPCTKHSMCSSALTDHQSYRNSLIPKG